MRTCPKEDEVPRLGTDASETPPWRDHLATCSACRNTYNLTQSLQHEARSLREISRVPKVEMLMLKASLRANAQKEFRLTRPIDLVEGVTVMVAVGLTAVLVRACLVGTDEGWRAVPPSILLGITAIPSLIILTVWLLNAVFPWPSAWMQARFKS
jgi:predicted anti-sigma-YlaC factor YlaD